MAAGVKISYLHEFPDPTPYDYETDAILEFGSELMGGFDNDPVPGAEMLNMEASRFYTRNASKGIETRVGIGSGFDSIQTLKELIDSDYMETTYAGSRKDFLRDTRPDVAERRELPNEERFTGDRLMHALRYSDEYADSLEFYSRMATAVESSLVTELSETRESSAMFSNTACGALETSYESIDEQSKELNDAIKQLLSLRKSKAPGVTGEVEETVRRQREQLVQLTGMILDTIKNEKVFYSEDPTISNMTYLELMYPNDKGNYLWEDGPAGDTGTRTRMGTTAPPGPFTVYVPKSKTGDDFELASIETIFNTPDITKMRTGDGDVTDEAVDQSIYLLKVLAGGPENKGLIGNLMRERYAVNQYYRLGVDKLKNEHLKIVTELKVDIFNSLKNELIPVANASYSAFKSEFGTVSSFSKAAEASRAWITSPSSGKKTISQSYKEQTVLEEITEADPSKEMEKLNLATWSDYLNTINPMETGFRTRIVELLETLKESLVLSFSYRDALINDNRDQFEKIRNTVIDSYNKNVATKENRKDLGSMVEDVKENYNMEMKEKEPVVVQSFASYVTSMPMIKYKERAGKTGTYYLPEIRQEDLNTTTDNWATIIDTLGLKPSSMAFMISSNWFTLYDDYKGYLSSVTSNTPLRTSPTAGSDALKAIRDNVLPVAYKTQDTYKFVESGEIRYQVTTIVKGKVEREVQLGVGDINNIVESPNIPGVLKAQTIHTYIAALEYTIYIIGHVMKLITTQSSYLNPKETVVKKGETTIEKATTLQQAIDISMRQKERPPNERELAQVVMRLIMNTLGNFYADNVKTYPIDRNFGDKPNIFSANVIPTISFVEPSKRLLLPNQTISFENWDNVENMSQGLQLIKSHLETVMQDRNLVIQIAEDNKNIAIERAAMYESYKTDCEQYVTKLEKEKKDRETEEKNVEMEEDTRVTDLITSYDKKISKIEEDNSKTVTKLERKIAVLEVKDKMRGGYTTTTQQQGFGGLTSPADYKEKIKQLKTKITKLKGKVEKKDEKKKDLQSKYNDAHAKLVAKTEELKQKKEELKTINKSKKEECDTRVQTKLQEQKLEHQKQIVKLNDSIAELGNKANAYKRSAENAAKAKTDALNDLNEARKRIKELQKGEKPENVVELQNKITILEGEKTTAKTMLENFKKLKKVEIDDLERKLKAANAEIKRMETTIVRLRGQVEKIEKPEEIEKMMQEISELKEKIRSAEADKQREIEKQRTKLQAVIDSLEIKNNSLSTRLETKKNELKDTKEALKEKDRKVNDLIRNVDRLRQSIIKGSIAEQKAALQESEISEKNLRRIQKERTTLGARADALEIEIDRLAEENKIYLDFTRDLARTIVQTIEQYWTAEVEARLEVVNEYSGDYRKIFSIPPGDLDVIKQITSPGFRPPMVESMSTVLTPEIKTFVEKYSSWATHNMLAELDFIVNTCIPQEGFSEISKRTRTIDEARKREKGQKTSQPPSRKKIRVRTGRSEPVKTTSPTSKEGEEGRSRKTTQGTIEISPDLFAQTPAGETLGEVSVFEETGSSTIEGSESDERGMTQMVEETPNQADLPSSFFGGVPEMNKSFGISSKKPEKKENSITKAMRNLFL